MQPTAKFQYVQLLSKTDKHITFYETGTKIPPPIGGGIFMRAGYAAIWENMSKAAPI